MQPVRIQRRRAAGYDMQAESRAANGLACISVTRPGHWGNPYDIGRYGLETSLALFESTVHGTWDPAPLRGHSAELRKLAHAAHVAFVERLGGNPLERVRAELRGYNLACYCALPRPGEPDRCHAAIYLKIANQDR